MSETKQAQGNPKDVFSVYQQSVDKLFSGAKQSIPQYHQSITNAQQECIQAFESAVSTAITTNREFARKAGVATSVPDAATKAIRDTADEFAKATAIQNQLALATIDAAQQNIKAFGDGAKLAAELNKNVVQSWIAAFATKGN